jgi:endonuclease/exonuclease/phosphatase family metal-dependent hydrolase
MQEIATGSFVKPRWTFSTPRSIRVVDWNIARGVKLDSVLRFLKSSQPDLIHLQEVDVNARRSHRRNIAEEIARALQLNYVWGLEFQELIQGSRDSPAYTGQATLSPWPLRNARVIRFRRQSGFWNPRWFVPNTVPFQERLGGRIALAADLEVGGVQIASYNPHLESRGGDDLRLSQIEEMIRDSAKQSRVIMAGDFNINCSRPDVAHRFDSAGFRCAVEIDQPTTISFGFLYRGRMIDWAFVRGPGQVRDGRQHNDVPGSDHYPISFELALR